MQTYIRTYNIHEVCMYVCMYVCICNACMCLYTHICVEQTQHILTYALTYAGV